MVMKSTGEISVHRESSSAKRLLGQLFEQVVHRQWSRPEQADHIMVLIVFRRHKIDTNFG
ncbi:hypothetical protein [Streptomyces sp. SLBN-118]|uniref:hypothetical protein n=1 Tax=Streptomyces sp. SLBN-118 TaxID=2768454 RepID=UPI0016435D82|nr:hypothetical protein [Streptomyces sp. SLBN-118]